MATTTAVKPTSAREGTAQAYVADLELQKKWAKALYDEASAKSIKAQKDYSRALAWETLLKECWNSVNTTDLLVEDLCASFGHAIKQAGTVKDDAGCIVEAFKNMVSDVKTLTKCLEKLKAYADQLKSCLSSMDASDPLMAGLDALCKAIDAAFDCAKNVLAAMLQVLKDAQAIFSQLKPDFGVEKTLREMEIAFKKDGKKAYYDYSGTWAPCLEPVRPPLPLKDHKDGYYEQVKKDLDNVTDCLFLTGGLRDIMAAQTLAANEALACYNTLDAALKAAQAALACKTK
jgi:hypothetical protein